MLTEAPFATAATWTQPERPPRVNGQRRGGAHVRRGVFGPEENEALPFARTGRAQKALCSVTRVRRGKTNSAQSR